MAAAVKLLNGQGDDGEDDTNALRAKLLSGFQYILVDEYQDVNALQYELISALAGRALQAEEQKLTMFAVGDDDQNIYEWNGSSNQYIQRFKEDYQASAAYLTVNYRSCVSIVNISNQWISQHPNRLKQAYPILPVESAEQGKVRLFKGEQYALEQKTLEICQYLIKKEGIEAQYIAILCRQHEDYKPLLAALRVAKLSVCVMGQKEGALPWKRLREVDAMLKVFEDSQNLSTKDIRDAWRCLPEYVQEHASTMELWQWLDSVGAEGHESEEIMRSIYEWRDDIHELSRESYRKSLQGIRVGTMHGAKGLEFHTVIVFAGKACEPANYEEELRLRYVAMTRSQQNLILMQADGGGDWFSSLTLEATPLPHEVRESVDAQEVYVCRMDDVDLDYLAHQDIKRNTQHIREGLELEYRGGILSYQSLAVGKLSRAMAQTIEEKRHAGWGIASCKVYAMIRRYKSDSREGSYRDRCKHEAWDVVIPEISFQKNMYAPM